jgi:hypothetical protein
VGPRAGLEGRGKSRPHRDSIPDCPARSSVTIRTELPAPHNQYAYRPTNALSNASRMIYIISYIFRYRCVVIRGSTTKNVDKPN